jgi:hypothetical protein
MRNPKSLGYDGRNNLVKRLLHKRRTPRFQQTTPPVDDLPALLQKSIGGIVWRPKVQLRTADSLTNEDIANILRERILEEVDVLPS